MRFFKFLETISNWDDWGRVYQSIPAFSELAAEILRKENLPAEPLKNLHPGTNAVFKSGGYVLKIFAPEESGIDQTADMNTEIFAISYANGLGVAAPKMIAHGFIEDKYRFAYIVTEFAEGELFMDAAANMTAEQKFSFARKLREITDKLNKPLADFGNTNAPFKPLCELKTVSDTGRFKRWDGFSESFKASRSEYIRSHDFGGNVFVHGDLCSDNIIVSPDGNIFIIDFADSLLAPACYEHALLPFEFKRDVLLMRGYFGNTGAEELAEEIFNGVLLHEFGGDFIRLCVKDPEKLSSTEELLCVLRVACETFKSAV